MALPDQIRERAQELDLAGVVRVLVAALRAWWHR